MQDRLRKGLAGHPSVAAGRLPEAWAEVASGEVGRIAEDVARRSFLYEDPGSFRAGVAELLRALARAGMTPRGVPA